MLLATAAAVAVGLWSRDPAWSAFPWVVIFDFFGTLFAGALKMLIVPLVCASIIVAMAGFGSAAELGRIGVRTISLYLLSTLSAVALGLLAVAVAAPGLIDGAPAASRIPLNDLAADLPDDIADKSFSDMLDALLSIVPANVVGAAAADDLLGLIFFSVLFGFFLARLESDTAGTLQRFWSGVLQIMLRMTRWVMLFAPLGVFGLVASAVARLEVDALGPSLSFAVVVVCALALHALAVLPALLLLLGKASPLQVYRATAPAVVTAFATASSATALPMTLQCVEERLAVPPRLASLVLPLGSSLNLNGTALYQAAAALFLAQVYGLELGLQSYLSIAALAVLASVSIPGVPSASLATMAMMLSALGLPAEALGLLLVFDRLLDMARTAVNVLGDVVCAVLLSRIGGPAEALPAAD
jgi:Na+/H+-dicarboxylate symporter